MIISCVSQFVKQTSIHEKIEFCLLLSIDLKNELKLIKNNCFLKYFVWFKNINYLDYLIPNRAFLCDLKQ